ncbi:MAG: M56 family metallopeptidase [Planctomycetota bacterium]
MSPIEHFEWQLLSQRLLLTLIHFAWQAALATCVLAVALRLVRNDQPQIRYAVSSGVLFLLPLVALLTFCKTLPQTTGFLPAGPIANRERTIAPSAIIDGTGPAPVSTMSSQAGDEPTASEFDVAASSPRVPGVTHQRDFDLNPFGLNQFAPWISVLYSLGVLWMLVRTAVGVGAGWRLYRRAVPITSGPLAELITELSHQFGLRRVPCIAESDLLLAPAVIGLLRPTVVLPCSLLTGLTPTEISAVLSHELAHIRRYDVFVGIGQRVLESIFFFHPGVWWISKQVSREREHCCDDAAIRSGHATTGYVETLLRAAELCLAKNNPQANSPMVAASFFGRNRTELSRRVERLLAGNGSRQLALPRVLAIAMVVTLFGAFACLGAVGQGSTPTENENEVRVSSESDDVIGRAGVAKDSAKAKPDLNLSQFEAYRRHLVNARTTKRDVLLKYFGGTKETELAVADGLRWILRQQRDNGSWTCRPGHVGGKNTGSEDQMAVAGTALALLALSGSGSTHQAGDHQAAIKRGTAFLMKQQLPDGRFRGQQMYVHAIATYAVADLYALTGDDAIRVSLEKAVAYSVQAQDPVGGGWRYAPRQAGDLSMTSWFVAGLTTARDAGISIPKPTLAAAKRFVLSTETGNGFAYLPGSQATPSMTGAGILCLQHLSGMWSIPSNHRKGETLVKSVHLRIPQPDSYEWLHVTQALRNHGGEMWDQWNEALRVEIPRLQLKDGPEAGSWRHQDSKYGSSAGPLYTTCFAVLTLQSYYREGALPIGKTPRDQPTGHKPPPGSVVQLSIDGEVATIRASQEIQMGFLQSILAKLEDQGIEEHQIGVLQHQDAPKHEAQAKQEEKRQRIELRFGDEAVEIQMSRALPYKYVMTVLAALKENGFESRLQLSAD